MAWDTTKTSNDYILSADWNAMVTDQKSRANKLATITTISTNYTVASTDSGNILKVTDTATITLPTDLDDGFQAVILNASAATVTLSSPGTLNTKDSNVSLANQYGAATILYEGSNIWYGFGDLS